MRHLKVLLTILLAAGMMSIPAVLWPQTVTQAEISQHYTHQLKLKDEARQVKMEIADTESKLGATILMDSDRASLATLLGDDRDRLRGYRAALRDGLVFLRLHWEQLTNDQRFEVQEEETYPE